MTRKNPTTFSKPLIYDDALVTSLVKYGDRDLIVRLFLKSHGRRSAFFRGGQLRKKSESVLQAPGFANLGFYDSGEGSLLKLSQCELHPLMAQPARDLKQLGYFAYIAELVDCLAPEGEPNAELFSLCQAAYFKVMAAGAQAFFLRAFEIKILSIVGLLPELPHDAIEDVYFDPVSSTFSSNQTLGLKISPKALALAQDYLSNPIEQVQNGDKEELISLGRLFFIQFRTLTKRRLHSVDFLKSL